MAFSTSWKKSLNIFRLCLLAQSSHLLPKYFNYCLKFWRRGNTPTVDTIQQYVLCLSNTVSALIKNLDSGLWITYICFYYDTFPGNNKKKTTCRIIIVIVLILRHTKKKQQVVQSTAKVEDHNKISKIINKIRVRI